MFMPYVPASMMWWWLLLLLLLSLRLRLPFLPSSACVHFSEFAFKRSAYSKMFNVFKCSICGLINLTFVPFGSALVCSMSIGSESGAYFLFHVVFVLYLFRSILFTFMRVFFSASACDRVIRVYDGYPSHTTPLPTVTHASLGTLCELHFYFFVSFSIRS